MSEFVLPSVYTGQLIEVDSRAVGANGEWKLARVRSLHDSGQVFQVRMLQDELKHRFTPTGAEYLQIRFIDDYGKTWREACILDRILHDNPPSEETDE